MAAVWHAETYTNFGTGRLIAPGLVLTAKHVTDPQPGGKRRRKGWRVRLLRDLERNGRWQRGFYSAELVWWHREVETDLALLQLKEPVSPKANLVFCDLDQSVPQAEAVGFPMARWSDSGKFKEYRVEGALRVAEMHGPFVWTVPPGDSPQKRGGWRGMSGSGVTSPAPSGKTRLFGVVQEVPANFTAGQLKVARLVDAFSDEDFVELIRGASGQTPEPVKIAPPTSLDLVKGYVQRALRFVERQGISSSYVWPSVRGVGAAESRSGEEARRFVEGIIRRPDGGSVLLLGDYGTGKTSFCYMLLKRFGEEVLEQNHASDSVIPLYLNLKKLRVDETIFEAIARNLQDYGFEVSSEDFSSLCAKRGHFLFLLDGLDEVADRATFDDIGRVIQSLQALRDFRDLNWLLTSRTTYFPSHYEPASIGANSVIELSGFSDEDIERYIKGLGRKKAAGVRRVLDSDPDIREICRVPFHLYLLMSQVSDERKWTKELLYREFILNSISRNFTARLGPWPIGLRLRLLQELAFRWFKEKTYEWTLGDFQAFLSDHESELHGCDTDDCAAYLTNCTFFTRAYDKYRFIHMSIVEFLTAQMLVEEFFACRFNSWNEPLYVEVYEFIALILKSEPRPTMVATVKKLMEEGDFNARANFTAVAFRHRLIEIVPHFPEMLKSTDALVRLIALQGMGLYEPAPGNVLALIGAHQEENSIVAAIATLVAAYWLRTGQVTESRDSLLAMANRHVEIVPGDVKSILRREQDEKIIRAFRKALVQPNGYWTAHAVCSIVLAAARDTQSYPAINSIAAVTDVPEVKSALESIAHLLPTNPKVKLAIV